MTNLKSNKKLKEFGLLIGCGIPLIFGFLVPILWGHSFKAWIFFLFSPFTILGIFKPSTLLYPYKGWMFFGQILGWINSRLILGLIFFTVLIPISFFMQIFGYDPLKKKKIKINSYRENKINNKIDLTRIF